MAKWAERNRDDFYRVVYPRLITNQHELDAKVVSKIVHETITK